MTTVTCKIPEGLNTKLEMLARQNRVSKSQIMREALENRLKPSDKKAAPRAIDLVRHLRGRVVGTPEDLATNPGHMKGFGE
jgi:predicted transcriptional regulator